MTTLIALAFSLVAQSGDLERLDSPNPKIRLPAIQIAGQEQAQTAVARIVRRLQLPDEREDVKAAALEALASITGRTDLKDAAAWQAWWDSQGKTLYPESPLSHAEIFRQVDARITQETSKLDVKMAEAKKDIRFMTISMAVAIFIFLIVMIFFVGNVSSKIKGWRELVSRAEIYIKHSQELTERTDKVAAELDAKKVEVMNFVAKLREENESGIERFGDMLGKNLEHEMREQLQGLRQRAEKELEQTLTDLKTQLEIEARRVAAEMRNRMEK